MGHWPQPGKVRCKRKICPEQVVTADYNDGNYFHYTYDAAGNRLSQTTPTSTNEYVYDAANRLSEVDSVAYTWDNNGNLVSDGQTTYSYDSANRLTSLSRGSETHSYLYNGQGDRVEQTVNGSTTAYLLDPRLQQTQVLGDGDNFYLYQPDGMRLGEVGAAGWQVHLPDKLGSVRQLAQTNGEIVGSSSYEPFGATLVNFGQASTFQYAGEARDASGLTFLRARYLDSTQGRFISQDPWMGDIGRPQSLNGWNYVENNPINLTDPSGLFPEYCHTALTTVAYEHCVRTFYNLEPIDELVYLDEDEKVKGTPGCYYGPIPYRAPGYLEGVSYAGTIPVGFVWGKEIVYDFASMEQQEFEYAGFAGSDVIGVSTINYTGVVFGFRTWGNLKEDYKGFFEVVSGGVGLGPGFTILKVPIGVSTGIAYFEGHPDNSVYGAAWYIGGSAGIDLVPLIDMGLSSIYYTATNLPVSYVPGTKVEREKLLQDINNGVNSPWPVDLLSLPMPNNPRDDGYALAQLWADIYDSIHYYSYPDRNE